MPQVRVIVEKLNKRSAPVIDLTDKSNIIGEVRKGFSFEAEKHSNEIGDWYKDRDNSFYWSGGLSASGTATPPPYAEQWGWAHNDFGIPALWNSTGCRGENTRVAILDSGINDKLPAFTHILSRKNFDPASGGEGVEDDTGHGTRMAGIIGGSGYPVTGVAPNTELLIAKVNTDMDDSLLQAIHWAAEQQADIISMSFECPSPVAGILEALQQCRQKGIALICAAGNGGSGGEIKNKYPASYPCCFSIGACTKTRHRLPTSNFSDYLSMLSPGEDVLTVNREGAKALARGTSIATAYTSGVVALQLSIARKRMVPATAVSIMESLVQNASHEPYMHNALEYGKGIINPVLI